MLLSEKTSSKKKGNVGLGFAIAWFCKNEISVSIPLNDTQSYDLVVDMDGLKKVQVKATSQKSPYKKYIANLRTSSYVGNGKFLTKIKKVLGYDYLFILTDSGDKYFIPTKEIKCKNALSLGNKYKKYIVQ